MPRQVLDEFLTKKQSGSVRLVVLPSASVSAYEVGATASDDGSGTTVEVFGLGTIEVGDIVSVNGSATLIGTVQSVASDGLSFVHNNSNLSWARLDRFVNTSKVAVLTEDAEGTSEIAQPVEAEEDGRLTVYVSSSAPVDLKLVDEVGGIIIKPDWGAVVGGVPTFRPEDYGSVTTAANVAISAAIAAADDAGGGIVQLERRTYPLAAAIEYLPGVTLRGVGMGLSILKLNAAVDGHCIQRLGTGAGEFGLIADLTCDGNDANQTTGTGAGIVLRNISTHAIERVEVKNCRGQGIALLSTNVDMSRLRVQDCYIHDVCSNSTALGGIAIGGTNDVDSVMVAGNWLKNIGDGDPTGDTGIGIVFSGAGTQKRIIIEGNEIEACQASGISLQANVSDIQIENNYIFDVAKGTGGNGIHLATASQALIKGNTIDTTGASADPGIEITGDVLVNNSDVTVEGNRLFGCKSTSIWVGTVNRCTVRGNLIRTTTAGVKGIDLNNNSSPATTLFSACVEANNVVLSSGGNGIDCRGWAQMVIQGNTVKGGTHGIIVDRQGVDETDITINGNVSSGNSADGIRVVCTGGTAALRIVVSNNVSYLNTQRGMTISAAKSVTIQGNVLEANGRSGLALDSVEDVSCIGNVVKNNGTANTAAHKEGIQLSGTSDAILINGNLIVDHTAGGNSGGQGIGASGSPTLTNVIVGNQNIFLGNQTDVEVSPVVIGLTTIASTAAMALTAGEFFVVSGTADITSITGGWPSRRVTLCFTGNAATNGLVKGSNLAGLQQSLKYIAGDEITLTFDGTLWQEANRSEADSIPSVVSAASITLPARIYAKTIEITGATGPIGTILGGWAGRKVSLLFRSSPTVTESASIKLAGVGDFVATADDVLTLAHDGTNWTEVGRSVN